MISFYHCLGGSPLHSSLISGFRHQSTDERYTAVFNSLFQCAQHVSSYIQNTVTWVLSVAQLILSVFSLDGPTLRITPARNGPSSQTRVPQASIARPTLLLCLLNMPVLAASFFKASGHLFY